MRKKIPKSGYRVLAIVWTLAAASMAVAFVRRLAEFNLLLLLLLAVVAVGIGLLLLLLLVLSTLTASNFWKTYRKTPGEAKRDPFQTPPRFSSNPQLFDDDPVPLNRKNKDSEENTP